MSEVILMAGLPAAGKTTAAARLHAAFGGVLIRSCDVFQDLGIDLPAWVERTRGFTVDVVAYDDVRDRAYVEMRRRLDAALAEGAAVVIVDAVYGEREKRGAASGVAARHGAPLAVVLCRCADMAETRRRIAARQARPDDPANEARSLAVYHDIARRWTDPAGDRGPDDAVPTVVGYDTLTERVALESGAATGLALRVEAALAGALHAPLHAARG